MDTGALIDKYIRILGAEDVRSRPSVTLVKPKLGRHWLGIDVWSTADPETTSIQIDERVAREPRSFERILAHEVIHHVNWVRAAQPYMGSILAGAWNRRTVDLVNMRAGSHGAEFMKLASVVNAAMGEGFVTQYSDQSYEYEKHEKSFYMLIVPMNQAGTRLGYKWGIKPSARALSGAAKFRVAFRHRAPFNARYSGRATTPSSGSGSTDTTSSSSSSTRTRS